MGIRSSNSGQFTKGVPRDPRIAKGGKRPGAGRPTNAKREAKKLVMKLGMELAKKYLEDHLLPIMDSYIAAAGGPGKGKARKFDAATNRHAVERVIGPAPRSLILDMQDTVETFFDKVEKVISGKENKEDQDE